MVALSDLTDRQQRHVMSSDRYSVRHGQVWDDVEERLADVMIFQER